MLRCITHGRLLTALLYSWSAILAELHAVIRPRPFSITADAVCGRACALDRDDVGSPNIIERAA